MPLTRYLDRQLELDARSLALGRIGLALALLYDLALRASDLTAHYTDAGVLPRADFSIFDWSFAWSLHGLSGTWGFEACLFALSALAGLALLVGWHSWAATLACALLANSVQARNPFLHDGQDDLLRVVLVFCLFVPLGRAWSLDARRRVPLALEGETASAGHRVSGLRAVGLAGQLAIVYGSSVVGKLQSAWWTSGNGIVRALQLGRYETRAGQWLLGFPGLLHLASWGVMAVELLLPILLLVPWRRTQLRLLAVVLGTALHLSFGLFMRLSIFPLVSAATWWLFLPAEVWRRVPAGEAPAPGPRWPALAALPLLCLATLYVVDTHRREPLSPPWLHHVTEALGLGQYWVVFAPRDAKNVTDGYFVAEARLGDGRTVDLFAHDGPVTWRRPDVISTTFRNTRWRHFYANLVTEWPYGSAQWKTTLEAREATANWLCRDWADRHPAGPAIQRVSLSFVAHGMDPAAHIPEHRRLIAQTACR
ncbi:MAG TPA: HTTM domain-containing protein [Myxococcales bacterium]|nr:HTTM domain-containing protein [Myxococcales bacterium]